MKKQTLLYQLLVEAEQAQLTLRAEGDEADLEADENHGHGGYGVFWTTARPLGRREQNALTKQYRPDAVAFNEDED